MPPDADADFFAAHAPFPFHQTPASSVPTADVVRSCDDLETATCGVSCRPFLSRTFLANLALISPPPPPLSALLFPFF